MYSFTLNVILGNKSILRMLCLGTMAALELQMAKGIYMFLFLLYNPLFNYKDAWMRLFAHIDCFCTKVYLYFWYKIFLDWALSPDSKLCEFSPRRKKENIRGKSTWYCIFSIVLFLIFNIFLAGLFLRIW